MGFTGWRYWTLVAGGVLAILLVVADFALLQRNTAWQAEVNQRQQFINQSIELNRVEQTLVRTIAIAATHNNDNQLVQVLAEQGIRVSAPPPAAAPAAAPAENPPAVPDHRGKHP